ncbi:hypothetical protein EVAR_48371_1 [Eumeta japonica]|uniref:Uncharacterized protein n=1 Tax=Eumeta variegata TaxID=151549 RepID=A0A4C1WIN6_EUMVA|nr:hypothetical protein EVAR_48371_1 [Eumeta japonica]
MNAIDGRQQSKKGIQKMCHVEVWDLCLFYFRRVERIGYVMDGRADQRKFWEEIGCLIKEGVGLGNSHSLDEMQRRKLLLTSVFCENIDRDDPINPAVCPPVWRRRGLSIHVEGPDSRYRQLILTSHEACRSISKFLRLPLLRRAPYEYAHKSTVAERPLAEC